VRPLVTNNLQIVQPRLIIWTNFILVGDTSGQAPASGNRSVGPKTWEPRNATVLSFRGWSDSNALMCAIWTNWITRTNGLTAFVWGTYRPPDNWWKQNNPGEGTPALTIAPHSLFTNFHRWSAISRCNNNGGGSTDQCPVTAITRRHGITRGHFFGGYGLHTNAFLRLAFLDTNQNVVVMTSSNRWVQDTALDPHTDGYDFSVVFFTADLPPQVELMPTIDVPLPARPTHASLEYWLRKTGPGFADSYQHLMFAPSPAAPQAQFLRLWYSVPWLQCYINQAEMFSANDPLFPAWNIVGGDSGSAMLMPAPNGEWWLIGLIGCPYHPDVVQKACDLLSAQAGLNPADYRWERRDISRYPDAIK
jgi:hypothetical protein